MWVWVGMEDNMQVIYELLTAMAEIYRLVNSDSARYQCKELSYKEYHKSILPAFTASTFMRTGHMYNCTYIYRLDPNYPYCIRRPIIVYTIPLTCRGFPIGPLIENDELDNGDIVEDVSDEFEEWWFIGEYVLRSVFEGDILNKPPCVGGTVDICIRRKGNCLVISNVVTECI